MPKDPHPDEFPFAGLVVGGLVRNLPYIVGALALGGIVGGLALALESRPFEDKALVEIGLRFLETPIEHPIEVRERLADAMVRSPEFGPHVDINVFIRRQEKTNLPTRYLDVVTYSQTATAARAVMDHGLQTLLANHLPHHREALAIAQTQQGRLRSLRDRVNRAQVQTADLEDNARLGAASARADRLLWGTGEVINGLTDTPTRVVTRRPEPTRVPARGPTWLLGGLIAGLLLGLGIAAIRSAPASS